MKEVCHVIDIYVGAIGLTLKVVLLAKILAWGCH